jgi:hypothetical protein
MFEEQKTPTPKVGVIKFPSMIPGEHRYAVAIRNNLGLWLTLWVRRSWKPEFFVIIPRAEPGWNPHTSYHFNGTLHAKSFGTKVLKQKRQPLTGPFRGTEHLGAYAGHGASIGAVCDPTTFSGVVEAAPDVLGPREGQVVVDLVEPGSEALSWPGEMVRKKSSGRLRLG